MVGVGDGIGAFFFATFFTAFFGAAFLAAGFLATAFLAAGFLATAFFAAGFLATAFFAAGFLATAYLAAGFLATAFFAGFLTAAFLAAGFFAAFFGAAFFTAAFIAMVWARGCSVVGVVSLLLTVELLLSVLFGRERAANVSAIRAVGSATCPRARCNGASGPVSSGRRADRRRPHGRARNRDRSGATARHIRRGDRAPPRATAAHARTNGD